MGRRTLAVAAVILVAAAVPAAGGSADLEPPLATSSNVHYLAHIPGTAAGMNFKDHYAYASGWGGIMVLDIAQADSPQVVGNLPLPHFENEDVDLCARLGDEGRILYLPAARFRHRGGESASRLGYDRFLPIFYRNAIRYRAAHYGAAARLAYRLLLVKGMALRLLVLPLRADVPRPRPEAARAYLRVLKVALGLAA